MEIQVDQLVEAAVGGRDQTTSVGTPGEKVLMSWWARSRAESALNELGESVMVDQIVGLLVNRLQVEHWYARHPEIEEQEIVAPLFGLGLPRTGSTALSFLLASDTARRSLRTWEAGRPCPPPETATEHTDPRIAETQAGIDMMNEMFPGFVGMLPTSATGPQECILIMALDFRSQVFEGMASIPPTARGSSPATWSPPIAITAGSCSCCSGAARRSAGGSRRRRTCTRSTR